MPFCRGVLLVLLCALGVHVSAQVDTVKLKLTIYDGNSRRPLAGVSVINTHANITYSTDGKGYLEQTIGKKDTLFLFSPGFHITMFSLADSVQKPVYTVNVVIEALTTGLGRDVIIRAPKTLEQIEQERHVLGTTPKELDKPKMVISSPISALYDLLSNRAHEREKLKKQMIDDDRRKIFKELFNYYNEKHIFDLPEDHYESFIDFLNLPIEFLKTSSDYDIMKVVTTQYQKYARLNGLIK